MELPVTQGVTIEKEKCRLCGKRGFMVNDRVAEAGKVGTVGSQKSWLMILVSGNGNVRYNGYSRS